MVRNRKASLVAATAAALAATVYWLANTWSGSVTFPDGTRGEFAAPGWVQAASCAAVGVVAGCAAAGLAILFIRKSPNQTLQQTGGA